MLVGRLGSIAAFCRATESQFAKNRPTDTFAAVHYRDYWFWVDDGDWKTKRAFTAVMFFFTLAETGGSEKLPLITIPAQ